MTKRTLKDNKIEHKEIDITQDKDAEEYVKNVLGAQAAPIVVVKQTTDSGVIETDFWVGFKPERIKSFATV